MEERFVTSYKHEAFFDRLLADVAFLGEMSSVAILTEVISIMFLESFSRKRLTAQGTDKTLGVEDFTIIFYPGRLDALVAMVTNLCITGVIAIHAELPSISFNKLCCSKWLLTHIASETIMVKAFALVKNLCLSRDKLNPAGVAYPEHSRLRAWMTGRFVVVVGKFLIKLFAFFTPVGQVLVVTFVAPWFAFHCYKRLSR